jgi:hypothetical protein
VWESTKKESIMEIDMIGSRTHTEPSSQFTVSTTVPFQPATTVIIGHQDIMMNQIGAIPNVFYNLSLIQVFMRRKCDYDPLGILDYIR